MYVRTYIYKQTCQYPVHHKIFNLFSLEAETDEVSHTVGILSLGPKVSLAYFIF